MSEVIRSVIVAGGGDYTSLTGFESGEQRTLGTDEFAVAECQTGTDTAGAANWSGWVFGSGSGIRVREAAGHLHGFVFKPATGNAHTLAVGHTVHIRGIHIFPDDGHGFIKAGVNTATMMVERCLIQGQNGNDNDHAIVTNAASTWFIWNNIIWDWQRSSDTATISGIICNHADSVVHASNNTVVNCRYGITQSAGTLNLKNNIVQSCTTADYSGTFGTTATNISSDTTSPETGLRSITLTFVDAANDDYHLDDTDTAAIGAGTDLHADGTLAFADDFDGDSRPNGAWDIGADQIPAASGITLTADGGSYTLSGTAATLRRDHVLSAEAGSYTLSGTAATLSKGYFLAADGGSYTLTGTAATLTRHLLISAEEGSYTLSGTAATLLAAYLLTADSGSYELTGTAADLLRNHLLGADSGTYTLTGEEATLTVTSQDRIIADSGAYALTGGDATLTVGAAGGGGGFLLQRRRRRS